MWMALLRMSKRWLKNIIKSKILTNGILLEVIAK